MLSVYGSCTWLTTVLIISNISFVICSNNEDLVAITESPNDNTFHESNNKVITNHCIAIVGNDFVVDGQPLHIISGSLHYFRVPAVYWRDRLHKLKAAGLNAVSTYVEWSFHEPEERQYTFAGDRNIAEFIKTAAEERLYVLLRPGPYICAERDLGGFPYWLLGKYPNIKLRTTDKNFIEETEIWMNKLFEQLNPYLFGNGGPIILVQAENEYGSYGNDMAYKIKIRDIMATHVENKALLYTTDGVSKHYFIGGAVPGALTTVDFGATKTDMQTMLDQLRVLMPSGPLMNSEFYTGWITHWGEPFAQVSRKDVEYTLKNMLNYKINVNFYMFFGGTNFEFTAGANYDGTYQPDITSYDYDAPLSEAGDPTSKYYDIRNAVMAFKKEKWFDPPLPSSKGNYGRVLVHHRFNLLSPEARALLGIKYDNVTGSQLPTFESLRQRSGLMLYETVLDNTSGSLEIQKPRDDVFVYVDGVLKGKISRAKKIFSLAIVSTGKSVLALLVENQGRINYGPRIHDRKGILSEVTFGNKVLNGTWSITGYPLENIDCIGTTHLRETAAPWRGAAIFDGQFTLPKGQPALDTFLDTTGWGKGYIWINGHNLGRYWPSIGPQVTLYVPGVWLRTAPEQNSIVILELQKPTDLLPISMQLIDCPILNRTRNDKSFMNYYSLVNQYVV